MNREIDGVIVRVRSRWREMVREFKMERERQQKS